MILKNETCPKIRENITKFQTEIKNWLQTLWNNENNIGVMRRKLTTTMKESVEIIKNTNWNNNKEIPKANARYNKEEKYER